MYFFIFVNITVRFFVIIVQCRALYYKVVDLKENYHIFKNSRIIIIIVPRRKSYNF